MEQRGHGVTHEFLAGVARLSEILSFFTSPNTTSRYLYILKRVPSFFIGYCTFFYCKVLPFVETSRMMRILFPFLTGWWCHGYSMCRSPPPQLYTWDPWALSDASCPPNQKRRINTMGIYCIWRQSLCDNADLLVFLREADPVSFWNVSFALPEIQERRRRERGERGEREKRREKKKPEHSIFSSTLSTHIITTMREERRKFKWAKKGLECWSD